MSAKTRIFVLKKREVIYTGIFLALGITLIILLVLMFRPDSSSQAVSGKIYTPGIYTAPITLNSTEMNLEVRVDNQKIRDIRLVSLSDAVTTMFPLIQPSLDSLASQIYETQSTENLYYEASNQYTSQLLINKIDEALSLAKH